MGTSRNFPHYLPQRGRMFPAGVDAGSGFVFSISGFTIRFDLSCEYILQRVFNGICIFESNIS
ncbi:hypothetical protein KsCSTR_49520 [Candidatus Kuenenia stuttgartiensis]|uniref:Uncharacterized protein n=1 Tax=Kuenenia stuttgartiensis TaxID=174633 RepID=Q1PVE3_KUEST|nr:hypothetical protein KsCSTR_49520 [Candidatus Kuenenia stuttgartiensis]CAJ71200.1 unknown protein [Candidatus Kuenenia stuttgartiensis]